MIKGLQQAPVWVLREYLAACVLRSGTVFVLHKYAQVHIFRNGYKVKPFLSGSFLTVMCM